ncbi:MAG: helix-turn-helix domain-containing protein [Rickettsiales bacterium]
MVSSKNSIQISFGKKVRDLRIKSGYSQEAFAFECGLHRTYIGCIERGEKNITIVNIEKIAKALKVEVYKLFQE